MTNPISPSKNSFLSIWIFLIFLIVAVGLIAWQLVPRGIFKDLTKSYKGEISLVYAPELEPIINQINDKFNSISDYKLKATKISSGEARTQIVSKQIKPDIYLPTSSAWLEIANFESSQNLFDTAKTTSVAYSPVGIAMWESKYNLVRQKFNKDKFSWNELTQIASNPNGWKSLDSNLTRANYYGGMTDPQISTTGLSALISQYYNASKLPENLSVTNVNDETVKEQVRNYQSTIRHYSANTVVFREYLSRGSDYIDSIPLAENDLIYVNNPKTGPKPNQKLVMVYPEEGSIVHNYPLGISSQLENSKQDSVNKLKDLFLSSEIQNNFTAEGFRPADLNKHSNLSVPFNADYGVNPKEPLKKLTIPIGEVLSKIQNNWQFTKKRAKIQILLDTSGSMQGAKIKNAKKALDVFTNDLSGQNKVGLTNFNTGVTNLIVPENLETNKPRIQASYNELPADGSTALYDGIIEAISNFKNDSLSNINNEIQAVLVLSDGGDTSSKNKLSDVLSLIEKSQNSNNPIIIIPVAYGTDADMNVLNSIARSSKTTVQQGDTDNIQKLLANISSYF